MAELRPDKVLLVAQVRQLVDLTRRQGYRRNDLIAMTQALPPS